MSRLDQHQYAIIAERGTLFLTREANLIDRCETHAKCGCSLPLRSRLHRYREPAGTAAFAANASTSSRPIRSLQGTTCVMSTPSSRARCDALAVIFTFSAVLTPCEEGPEATGFSDRLGSATSHISFPTDAISPFFTLTCTITPAEGDKISLDAFIDSTTNSTSPSATVTPFETLTSTSKSSSSLALRRGTKISVMLNSQHLITFDERLSSYACSSSSRASQIRCSLGRISSSHWRVLGMG